MAINSLTGALSLGKQADRTTQATTFYKALSLTSGLGVAFDVGEQLKEHPSSVAGTSLARASAETRTGYLVPWGNTFILRPNFIVSALQAMGFAVTTTADTPEAGVHSHSCEIAADASIPWMSVVHDVGGDGLFLRRALSARASQLNITANNTDIRCDLSGTALVEGNVSGSPTYVAEANFQLLPTAGSFTANIGGGSLTTEIRGLTCNMAQPLKEGKEELPLFQADRTSLDRQNIDITGELQGVDIDFNMWKKIIRGGTGGTLPSLTVAEGDLNFKFESAAVISGEATKYSVEFDFPSVYYTLPNEGVRNNADDLVRVAIGWNMFDTPCTITVINTIASY